MNTLDVTVESTWEIEDVEKLPSKILWKDETCELTEEANVDNCFVMNQPPSDENTPCTLKLSLKNNRRFHTLQILSGASVIEVHGKHEEYILTSKGELLDDVDGALLFESRIQLAKLQPELLLKFHRKNISSLWVYGICAITKEVCEKPKLNLPEALRNTNLAMLPLGLNKVNQKDNLEHMIDIKFKEMEQKLMKHIDDKFSRLEVKIDENHVRVMNLLTQMASK